MKIIGWILVVWGGLGLLGNLVALQTVAGLHFPMLGVNSLICLLFLYFGRKLILRGGRGRDAS